MAADRVIESLDIEVHIRHHTGLDFIDAGNLFDAFYQ